MLQAKGSPSGQTGWSRVSSSFPEWAVREINRLLAAHQEAPTAEDRARCELQIAVLCDAARRYGQSLEEVAEI